MYSQTDSGQRRASKLFLCHNDHNNSKARNPSHTTHTTMTRKKKKHIAVGKTPPDRNETHRREEVEGDLSTDREGQVEVVKLFPHRRHHLLPDFVLLDSRMNRRRKKTNKCFIYMLENERLVGPRLRVSFYSVRIARTEKKVTKRRQTAAFGPERTLR